MEEESANYSAMPVDEILLSEAFDETPPFNAEMTELLQRRKQAIVSGDPALRRRLEAQLQQRNPEYFSYFDLDQRLGAILGGQ